MITLYAKRDCLPCKRVAQQLALAGIKVELVNVEEDQLAADFIKKSFNAKSVPVVHDDETGDVILGYEPTQLREFINARGN